MRSDLTIAGIVGLVIGASIYVGASALSTLIPILLSLFFLVAVTFLFLLALSLVEIPMMLFGLRQMARSSSTPRRLLAGTFAFYVMFASVYASIFVLLTGQISWGLVLAALGLIRFASGMWIR